MSALATYYTDRLGDEAVALARRLAATVTDLLAEADTLLGPSDETCATYDAVCAEVYAHPSAAQVKYLAFRIGREGGL